MFKISIQVYQNFKLQFIIFWFQILIINKQTLLYSILLISLLTAHSLMKNQSNQQVQIIGMNKLHQKKYYLIKKKHQPINQSKWIIGSALQQMSEQIREFNQKYRYRKLPFLIQDIQQTPQIVKQIQNERKMAVQNFQSIIGKVKFGNNVLYLIKLKNQQIEKSLWIHPNYTNIYCQRAQFNKKIGNKQLPYLSQQYLANCTDYKNIMKAAINSFKLYLLQKNRNNYQNPLYFLKQIFQKQYNFEQISIKKVKYQKYKMKSIIGKAYHNNILFYLIKWIDDSFTWQNPQLRRYGYGSYFKIFNQTFKQIKLPFIIHEYQSRKTQFLNMLESKQMESFDFLRGRNLISQIIGKKSQLNKFYYLIHFKGTKITQSKWILGFLLQNYHHKLKQFNIRIKNQKLPYISQKYIQQLENANQLKQQNYGKDEQLQNQQNKSFDKNSNILKNSNKLTKKQMKKAKRNIKSKQVKIQQKINQSIQQNTKIQQPNQHGDQSDLSFIKERSLSCRKDNIKQSKNPSISFDKTEYDSIGKDDIKSKRIKSIKFKQQVVRETCFNKQNIYQVKLLTQQEKEETILMKSSELMRSYPYEFLQMMQSEVKWKKE